MEIVLVLLFTAHPIAFLLVLALLHWPMLWLIVIPLIMLIGVVLLIVSGYHTWINRPSAVRRGAMRHARDIEEFRAKLPTYWP